MLHSCRQKIKLLAVSEYTGYIYVKKSNNFHKGFDNQSPNHSYFAKITIEEMYLQYINL